MSLSNRGIAVYDFETTGKVAEKCEPVEFACKVFNPKTLAEYPNGTFHAFMRPLNESLIDMETVTWHAKLKKKTTDEILADWRSYPDPKDVWISFANFIKPFNKGGGKNSVVPAGFNVVNFDSIIVKKLCKSYGFIDKEGNQSLFNNVFKFDLMDILFYFMNDADNPTSLSFDTLRKFFGLSNLDAHTALADVVQESAVLMRWLQYGRRLYNPMKFQNVFATKEEVDINA